MSSATPIPCIPGDRAPLVVIFVVMFTILATILVALRVYTRVRLVPGGLGWDDAFIVIAWALLYPLVGLGIERLHYGLGKHIGCVSPEHNIYNVKLENIGDMTLLISSLLSRLSICLFLLRLFTVVASWRWTLYTIIALSTAINIASAIIILIQCKPRGKLWNPTIPGTCWRREIQVRIGQAQGSQPACFVISGGDPRLKILAVISIVLDLILSGLPIYYMWKIQLSWRVKAGICGLMSLGVLTAVCALMRTILLGEIKGEDITWDIVPVLIWANSEVEIAVCVACIATLRPLFTRKSMKQSRQKPIFNESQMRLNYIKFSNDPRKQDKWTGQNFDGTGASYSTKASGDNAHGDAFQMENIAGIRRVIDVDVTV